MSDSAIFYIVRHGETDWNARGIIQGQTDIPLNSVGKEQAKLLAEKLKHIHFDEVFSSDLLRAKQTAELIVLERKLIVKTQKALRERKFGHFEGFSYEKYREELREMLLKYEKLSAKEKFKFKISDDTESDEELTSRFILFLRETAVAYRGKTLLIVCHGGLIRTFLIHLGFGTQSELPSGAVKNSGYVKIESDGIEFKIIETSDVVKNTSEKE